MLIRPAMSHPSPRLAALPLLSLLLMAACGPELPGDPGEVDDVGDDFEIDETDAGKADFGADWPVLRSGKIGRDVVAAQYLLRERGYSLAVDGEFGAATASTVKTFQRSRGLSADGVVGPATWDALVTGLSLRQGDTGSDVRAVLYLLLNRYGYSISVTGEFGATTDQRVREFQRDRCIEADGVIGPDTWFVLVAGGGGCGGGGSGSLVAAHTAGQLRLQGPDSEGSSPLDNIRDAEAGRPARRSARGHYGATRVYLKPGMVAGMAELLSRFGHYEVSSIAGGRHGATSHHYQGDAVDIAALRGTGIYGDSAAVREMMRLCVALGATEVIGPSSQVAGAWTDANHKDHIHCGGWR